MTSNSITIFHLFSVIYRTWIKSTTFSQTLNYKPKILLQISLTVRFLNINSYWLTLTVIEKILTPEG